MDNLTSYKNNHVWSQSDPSRHNTPPAAFITPQEKSGLVRAKKILQSKTKQFFIEFADKLSVYEIAGKGSGAGDDIISLRKLL